MIVSSFSPIFPFPPVQLTAFSAVGSTTIQMEVHIMTDSHIPFQIFSGSSEHYIHFFDVTPHCDLALGQTGWQIPYCRPLMPPQLKYHYVLHFVRAGEGYFRLRDRNYRIVPNTCFLIYPNQPTVYYTDRGGTWEYFWVGLVGSDVERILSTIGFSPDHQAMLFTNSHVFDLVPEIINSALQYKDDPLGLSLHTMPLICSLLFLLIEEARSNTLSYLDYTPVDNSYLMNQRHDGNKYVKLATQYIEKHYREPITVERIAEYLHLNRSYLSTLFKVNTHISLKQYLQQYRIMLATHFLCETTLSVTEIAAEVGFRDPLYFSRIFKAHLGISPTEYRMQQLPAPFRPEGTSFFTESTF